MTIKNFKIIDKGVEYNNFRVEKEAVASCCIGNKKIVLKGKPKIVTTKGSYKFNEELQFSISNFKGLETYKDRNPTQWDTIEICLPIAEGKELIKAMNEVLNGAFKETQTVLNGD